MDSINETNKGQFFKYLKFFIIILTVFVGIKSLGALKEYPYIGNSIPLTNIITVYGKGEVMAKPDIANFSFSVMEDGKTAKEAQDKATVKSNAALNAIKTAGVEEKDVKTISYNLSPKYEWEQKVCPQVIDSNGRTYPCSGGKSVIVGYTVSQSIEVKVRKIDDAGPLLTKIAAVGVSNISDINFIVDDQDILMEQAKEKAIADARDKALILAEQLDVDLGRIVSFSDQSGGPIYYAKAYAVEAFGMGGDSSPIPELPSGENKIMSSVSITYEIR